MKVLILPGYSIHNKEWAYDIAKDLNSLGDVVVHEWIHWKSGNFSVKAEVEKIKEEVADKEVDIIAKSVGTMICAKLERIIKMRKIILCGIPSVSDKRFEIMSKSFVNISPENILVIQNKEDPFATYKEVKEFFAKINPEILVMEKSRSDHNYPYPEDFIEYLKD